MLRVMMGRLCHLDLGLCAPDQAPVGLVNFTDGSPLNASYFDEFFPYLTTPEPGARNGGDSSCDAD
jgi:hypothetical protein